MNTCIKCGCDDAYPSLPPCPTPVDCPNPQPCAEFFNAQCVRYTLPDIMCGLNIVVAQDSSIADALESIVLFFCTNFSNSVQSVTGLNTDNTDPVNPIVKISVDGITITGLGTPASPLIAVGGIDGSGIADYVARWSDANTLTTGLIKDNGTNTSIGGALDVTHKLLVLNSTIANSVTSYNSYAGAGNQLAVNAQSFGAGTGRNIGVQGIATTNTVLNVGVKGITSGASAVNLGGWFAASGATNNYSLRLTDGSEASGRFLKSVTANGEANWADITAADVSGVVGGSGTADYLARWTPSGTQLGTGLIRDNGTNVGINIAPGTIAKVTVANTTVEYTVDITNGNTGIGAKAGIRSITSGVNGTGFNTGATFTARNNTLFNIGVVGESDGASTKNIGGFFTATGGTDNYSIRLQDTTEGVGKVLTCMTATGDANWVTPSSGSGLTWSTITGASPTATLAANNGYVIRDTSGAFTDLTLPSSGVVVGDIIKISATKEGGGGTLSTWRILEGSTTDVIFYSFYDITTDSEITGLKNTSPLLTFDDNVSGSYTVFKNQSLTLTCVEDLGTGYAWNLELANGKVIS